MAFVANLFNNHPGLEPPSPEQVVNVIGETREEKMFRNWINSLGVGPQAGNFYRNKIPPILQFTS